MNDAENMAHGCPPNWANIWGEDKSGIFVGFYLDDQEIRLRWVENGQFWVMEEPIDKALWAEVTGAHPPPLEEQHDPADLSRTEAQDLAKKLNEKVPDLNLVLPSETAWSAAWKRLGSPPGLFNAVYFVQAGN